MRRIKRKDEGAMGVGTLIVFIAMVLVAAVAASVLISTANKLQQQAQKTGDQAIREVSTAFTVRDVYGLDTDTPLNSEIDEVNLTVGLAAGSPVQNVNQTSILVRTASNEYMLSPGPWSDGQASASDVGAGNEYGVIPVKEQEEGNFGNIEQGDTVKIKITGLSISPQQELTIKILPKHGTPTVEELVTPPVINQYTTHF